MFIISEEQQLKLIEWMKDKPASNDMLGIRYEYCFTPTSLGTIVIVKDHITKTEINITNYNIW